MDNRMDARLVRELAVVMVVKLILLGMIWLAFFHGAAAGRTA